MRTLSTALNTNQAEGFYILTHGIDVDRVLYKEELTVQRAWAQALCRAGLLTSNETQTLVSALNTIESEMRENTFEWRRDDEDIHMNIERALTQRLGELGKRLHLGRSRNDLIATTIKLYLANQCLSIGNHLKSYVETIVNLAQRDIDILTPSYTHSQAAQPVRFGHIWNFHAVNFLNDVKRFDTVRKHILSVMPLGSGAVAGTHLAIPLESLAQDLGFENTPLNSIHGISDRDSVIESAQAIAMMALHINRLCEDVINWSSSAMRLVDLPRAWSSGSSMMPNKRNPDFFEVVRTKCKGFMQLQTHVTAINTSLTSGYASDFHEQKRVIVENIEDLLTMLPIVEQAVASINVNATRASELLPNGHILATDVANKLVDEGLSFRDAYKVVAERIDACEQSGTQVLPNIDQSFMTAIEGAIESRSNFGGTARKRILESISRIKDILKTL